MTLDPDRYRIRFPDWSDDDLEDWARVTANFLLIEHPPYDHVPLIIAGITKTFIARWRDQGAPPAKARRRARDWSRYVMRLLVERGPWDDQMPWEKH
jgi:hypothetical protein